MTKYAEIDKNIDFNETKEKYAARKLCKICGAPFISRRYDHELCSHRCNQRLYLLRKAAKAKLEQGAEDGSTIND